LLLIRSNRRAIKNAREKHHLLSLPHRRVDKTCP
jgi:hypothetical protein